MRSVLKYSNEIDWDNNINYSFKTERKLKFSKINYIRKNANKKDIRFEFPRFYKNNINKKININQKIKKIESKFKIFSNKSLVALYYGILFTLVFGFLFFLTISISYASNVENNNLDENYIYNKDNKEKLLEDYLFQNAKKENYPNKNYSYNINKKISYYKYLVKKNDSFEKIAQKTGLLLDTLYLVNNIKEKAVLRKGRVLIIPNQDGRLITVNKNDSIFKLADLYGIKWEKIADVNNLQSSVITPGTKLFIPGSRMTKYERKKFHYINFIWPIKGKITSYFGSRIDPITGVYSFHSGIDIKNRPGSKIKVAKDGKVIFIGWQKIYGNFIMVRHSDGYITLYAHLNKVTVNLNQFVEQGENIGLLGSTGRTTGPHLHFEIRRYGKMLDPLKFL